MLSREKIINFVSMKRIIFLFIIILLAGAGCSKKIAEPQTTGDSQPMVLSTFPVPSEQLPATPVPETVLEPPVDLNEDQIMFSQAIIKTNLGDITVKFYSAAAPNTVANFQNLAQTGFYDQVKFHRVIENFMIQAGDPFSQDDSQKDLWGRGGPGYQFADEINDYKLVKGSLAMANAGPNTNGSQFFIVTAPATPWLDGLHTNFGEVVDGMDVVDAISQVERDAADRPLEPIIIEGIELE